MAKAKTKAKSKPRMKAKKPMRKAAPVRKKSMPKAKSKAAKPRGVAAIPPGHHTVTPHLVIKGCAAAIDFYRRAFGAAEIYRMPGPDNAIMHAELHIGDSILYVCDEFPGMDCSSPQSIGGTTSTMHLYVPDVDAAFQKAVAAGARVVMPVMDMFWGDRYGKVADPFGHSWSLATHKEDVAPEQMQVRAAKAFSEMPGGNGQGPSADGQTAF
jgi:uncharacterized glyoxalase superfamily protein PhnB